MKLISFVKYLIIGVVRDVVNVLALAYDFFGDVVVLLTRPSSAVVYISAVLIFVLLAVDDLSRSRVLLILGLMMAVFVAYLTRMWIVFTTNNPPKPKW